MGVVYRALRREAGAYGRAEVPSRARGFQQRSRERFLREARTASSLDHPNIGVIHGLGNRRRSLFYRDGILRGRAPLAEDAPRSLPMAEAVDIAIQVGEGLARRTPARWCTVTSSLRM